MKMTNPVRSPRSKLLSAKGDKTQFLVFSAKKKEISPHLEFIIIIMYTVAGYRNYYSIYKEKKAQFWRKNLIGLCVAAILLDWRHLVKIIREIDFTKKKLPYYKKKCSIQFFFHEHERQKKMLGNLICLKSNKNCFLKWL